jgi:hypothetical protein
MKEILINTPEDMEWLADVHIKDLKINWTPRSAIIIGNEDAPDEIRLYPRRDPLVTDTPLVGHPHGDIGKFVFCGPLTHTEAMKIDAEEDERERKAASEFLQKAGRDLANANEVMRAAEERKANKQ